MNALVIRELTSVYDRLPDDLQAELPLKRVWTLALQPDEQG
jgi:predicted Mrr-cat superfamily restriction endonuclease